MRYHFENGTTLLPAAGICSSPLTYENLMEAFAAAAV